MPTYKRLTHDDRIKIETLLKQGYNPYQISKILGFSNSTIYREVNRAQYTHLTTEYVYEKRYSADKGDTLAAFHRTTRGRQAKIENDHKFAKFVEKMILKEKKSPAAILMHIEEKHLTFKTKVCLSTIYNYVRKGMFLHVTERDLWKQGKRKHKKKHAKKQRKALLRGISIEKRPKEVIDRTTFGHWELDSIIGKRAKGQTLLCLTERKTRYQLIFRAEGKTAEATEKMLQSLKVSFGSAFSKIFKSITCDNGTEFSTLYKQETPVYYCHPYSSWERGSNENQNGFIRRFIPKGTRIEEVTDEKLAYVQYFMNHYERAIHKGKTALQLFENELSKLGLSSLKKFF